MGASMAEFDYHFFYQQAPALLCITDSQGQVFDCNPAMQALLGSAPASGTALCSLFAESDRAACEAALAQEQDSVFEARLNCLDQHVRQVLWQLRRHPFSGDIYLTGTDVAGSHDANQRIQLAIDALPTALLMIDQEGCIGLVNRMAEKLFGYERGALTGKPVEALVPAELHVAHQHMRADFFTNPQARTMGEGRHIKAMRRDGKLFPVEIGLSPVQFSDGLYVLCSVVDMTFQKQVEERMILMADELREANEKLEEMAVTDILTGVFNRRAFDDQYSHQIQLMKRMGKPLSLVMIDIDFFKKINDTLGHQKGDEVLRTLGGILKTTARVTDIVARYGGEEFVVVLPNTGQDEALQMAERFRYAVYAHGWQPERVTVSVGAATIDFDGAPVHSGADFEASRLVGDADRALYYSKHNGRNRITHVTEMAEAGEVQ